MAEHAGQRRELYRNIDGTPGRPVGQLRSAHRIDQSHGYHDL